MIFFINNKTVNKGQIW